MQRNAQPTPVPATKVTISRNALPCNFEGLISAARDVSTVGVLNWPCAGSMAVSPPIEWESRVSRPCSAGLSTISVWGFSDMSVSAAIEGCLQRRLFVCTRSLSWIVLREMRRQRMGEVYKGMSAHIC